MCKPSIRPKADETFKFAKTALKLEATGKNVFQLEECDFRVINLLIAGTFGPLQLQKIHFHDHVHEKKKKNVIYDVQRIG